MQIRDAHAGDVDGITAIHNDAVTNTTALWTSTPVDSANRLAWLTERQSAGRPVLVAAGDAGEVLGYASFGDWRPHDGYRHTVEHSVYVAPGHQGQGIGRTLMIALIARARDADLHVMVAGIDAQNTGSIRLHESLGFTQVGHLPQVGTKFGRWLDLTFLQLVLDDRPAA